jgi:hypothetical protein
VHKIITSADNRVRFVNDRIPYIIIIVLKCHATTGDKIDEVKDSFREELKLVFYEFPKNHLKILLDVNAKVGREGLFKPTIGNES